MPLFCKSDSVPPQQVPVQTTTTRRGSDSSTISNSPPGYHISRSGLFSRRRCSSADSLSSSDYEAQNRSTTRSSTRNMFRRTKHEDPSIIAARERVLAAEQAEKDADAALQQTRLSVREAREYAHRLVAEAEAEAKTAGVKQGQAQNLDRRAKPLGRHDRF